MDSLPETPDLTGGFPRLTEGQIESLARSGTRRRTEAGEVLFRTGDECPEFFVILEGKVHIVDDLHGEARVLRVHGPGRFLGELGLLTGEKAFVSAVVAEPGEVLAVPVDELRSRVSRDPALADVVLRAYLIRRSMLIGSGSGFRIIGSRFSPDARRLRDFAARNRLPYRWIDVEEDRAAETILRRLGVPPEETPIVSWDGRVVLRNPSNAELARAIGLPVPGPALNTCDLLIVGAGPAGLAAAVYGASEGLTTTILDAVAAGGQAGTSPKIENYLGFPAGISGSELAERAVIQAEKFGAHIGVPASATSLDPRDGHYVIGLEDGTTVAARAVLIATGARYRRLDLDRLADYEGFCVFYAATLNEVAMCGYGPVVVVGGGNSAGQAALFLAEHALRVHLLVRGGDLTASMSRYLADRIERSPRVEVRCRTEVRELVGGAALNAVIVQNMETGLREKLDAVAMFVFIGAVPGTQWLAGRLILDDHGFVRTGSDVLQPEDDEATQLRMPLLQTGLPGVFAAGDVRRGSARRVASAVGEGAMAVRLIHEYLERPGPAGDRV